MIGINPNKIEQLTYGEKIKDDRPKENSFSEEFEKKAIERLKEDLKDYKIKKFLKLENPIEPGILSKVITDGDMYFRYSLLIWCPEVFLYSVRNGDDIDRMDIAFEIE